MSRTDERIREEIRRLADPPDPAGALDRVERLVARRAVARRAQTAGLANASQRVAENGKPGENQDYG